MPGKMSDQAPRIYAAFISYSHRDAAFARSLHRALERYVVPRSGRANLPLPKTARIRPIFRDEDEFAASSDLGAAIRNALNVSNALIVLCSPDAARSRWVNEEVRHYKARVDGGPIVAIMVPSDDAAGVTLPPELAEGGTYKTIDVRRAALTSSELNEIAASLLRLDLPTLRRHRRREFFVRWSTRLAAGGAAIGTVLGATSLIGVIIFVLAYQSMFTVQQDAIVSDPGCYSVKSASGSASIFRERGGDDWDAAARDARRALTPMYEACALREGAKDDKPDWLLHD